MSPDPILTCECKSWEFRQECKHIKSVEKALAAGSTFTFPISFRSLTNATTIYTIRANPPS